MIEEFLKAKNKITVIETAVVAVLSFVIVYYAPFIMGFMKNYYVNLAVRPLFYIALAAIPFIAGKITKNHLGPLIFKKDDILKQLLAGLYVFFISAAVLTAVSLIIGDYKYFLIGPKQTDIVFIIYNMFFYILCVGMGEEILFRGYLVFITAILGAFYGVSLYKVKDCSVLSLIVAHGLYNIYIIFLGLLLL
ncbi:MAG: Abortive infection protein [Sedimentibacter sp.]|nr:Abortive infection protein [Sedimentibacter sp.]